MSDKEELKQHLFRRMRDLTYPDWDDEIIAWYRQWDLEEVRLADDQQSVVFVWRDLEDGQRYAWRLQSGRLRDLFDDAADYLFLEDLLDTVASPPDDDGVRWLGVVPRDWERFNRDQSIHPRMA